MFRYAACAEVPLSPGAVQDWWTDFEQDRWRISILDYVAVDGLNLPRRLYLTRDDFKIRIVVNQWERR